MKKNVNDEQFNLNQLNGENGFVFDSNVGGDKLGTAVAGGFDINGDGISDVAMCAPYNPGIAYIIYGSANTFPTPITPTYLNSTNGIVLYGVSSQDSFCTSVSAAGDFNR